MDAKNRLKILLELHSVVKEGGYRLSSATKDLFLNGLEVLIEAPPTSSDYRQTADNLLKSAAEDGCAQVVRQLLAVGIGPEFAFCDLSKGSPLYMAVLGEHLQVIEALVEGGANMEAAFTGDSLNSHLYGETPLLAAVRMGCLEAVRLLVGAGAGLETTGKVGNTPISCAARAGHLDIVRFLAESGADVNSESTIGWTPLSRAACGGHLEVIRF